MRHLLDTRTLAKDDALRILDDGTPKKVVLYPNAECQGLDNSKQVYKQGK